MTRHEEIINAANEYVTKTHSPSTNEFQTAMNIAVVKAYIAAAKWADETHHEKCMDWLFDNFYEDEHDGDYDYDVMQETDDETSDGDTLDGGYDNDTLGKDDSFDNDILSLSLNV